MNNKQLDKCLWMALGAAVMAGSAGTSYATIFTQTIDMAGYNATGTVTFDDWGYTGPGGRTAMDFAPINGFGGLAEGNALDPTGGIGQIQHVITLGPDGLTPDGPSQIESDFGAPAGHVGTFSDASMDSAVNFYKWGYTSDAGSQFNNMRIDYDGDYLVGQNDMNFAFYSFFDYSSLGAVTGLPEGTHLTGLAFQPYALSDATGWCGSVMASHPNALEAMAGQVGFDFAFDVYFQVVNSTTGAVSYTYSSTEVVRDFQMRSYGDITVDVTVGSDTQQFSSRAVVNNTDPTSNNATVTGAPVDEAYHNLVSFHGAGVVPVGTDCLVETAEWQAGERGPGVKRYAELRDNISDCFYGTPGYALQGHAYSGYAFILRADAERIIDYFDESLYGPDPYAVVPVPAAVWLFGSGLIGLVGFGRRTRKMK